MLTSTGTFATPHASKYLQQLCKHFAHKVEVEFSETSGSAALPMGMASLVAEPENLLIVVRGADEKGLAAAKSVIDVHLERFAFREDFKEMNWS